jgi:hypothetical protein
MLRADEHCIKIGASGNYGSNWRSELIMDRKKNDSWGIDGCMLAFGNLVYEYRNPILGT